MHVNVDTLSYFVRDCVLQMVIASHTDMCTGANVTDVHEPDVDRTLRFVITLLDFTLYSSLPYAP